MADKEVQAENEVASVWSEKLVSIWDDDKIEQFVTPDGVKKWRCKWCDVVFPLWNCTKALAHVLKTPKKDI